MQHVSITTGTVSNIAKLANIPITPKEEEKLAKGFTETMVVVDQLFAVDVEGVDPTNQVTGLENILRNDEVDTMRTFTQEQALANSQRTHNGFFVVDQVIAQED
jgi:aspartyl-tRNA(Asn)/glutamyl-tRNA(Gln) amidotransferase subunit C